MDSLIPHNTWQHFGDELALFDLGHRDNHRIVEAATGLLIADPSTGPAVLALASAVIKPSINRFEMDDLVQSARDELAMKPLSSDQTLLRTTQTSIRLWIAGELTDTQLAEWVHNIDGHTGPDELQGLVEAHDMFGSLDYIDETEADIHQQIQACAQRVIAQVGPWEQDGSHSPLI